MQVLTSVVLALAVTLAAGRSAPLLRPAVPCPADSPDDQQVFVPSADSCSDFYLCSHGRAYQLSCPSGLYFNPATKRCDYQENVNCTNPTPAPTVVPTEPTIVPAETTPLPLQSTTVPSNSSDFNSTLYTLFQSQALDEEILEVMRDFCPAHAGRYPVFFPNPSNCSTYFMCDHGEPQLRACPSGLFFNIHTWTCDYQENVDCVQPTAYPVNGTAADLEVLNIQNLVDDAQADVANECPEEDGDFPVYLPNPADCATFFECSNGRPLLHHCPGDLLFNNSTSTCDFARNVDCV